MKSSNGDGIDTSDVNDAVATRTGGHATTNTIIDVSAPLERIRAKFKLLCTLLRTERSFDLGKVLESGGIEHARDEDDGLPRRSGAFGIETEDTIANEHTEDHGDVKSTSHGKPGSSAAQGESLGMVGSDW
jgi:hypothetical protein